MRTSKAYELRNGGRMDFAGTQILLNRGGKGATKRALAAKLLFVFVSAALFLTALTGCGSWGREDGVSPSPEGSAPLSTSGTGAETDTPQASPGAETPIPGVTDSPVSSPDENGFAMHTLVFPNNMSGRTEFNASVYDIKPFRISFKLPAGWYCMTHPAVREMYLGAWDGYNTGIGVVYSIYWIYDPNDVCVGAVGYDLYRAYSGHEDDPAAIYSMINADDNYRFATNEYYFPVSSGTNAVTALTQVYISSEWIKKYGVQNASDRLHTGIVSYDEDSGAYVAFHLFPSTMTATELIELAGSINFENTAAQD